MACLCAVTVGVFHRGLDGQWVRDDISLIQTNTYISDPALVGKALTSSFWTLSGAREEWNPVYSNVYRPVVTAAYIVQGRVFGIKPYGFHAVSLLLHLACVLLVWLWLRERLPGPPDWPKDVAVTLGAAVFALHPSRGEVVAWVSGSTDLWMTFFVLVALLVWNRRDVRRGAAPLVGALLGLAFLSKEAAIVVPVLLAADAWCLGPRPFPTKKLVTVGTVFGAVLLARHFVIPLTGVDAPKEASIETLRRSLSSLGHYVHLALTDWTPSVQVALRDALPGGEPYYAPWSVWAGAAMLALLIGLGITSLGRPRLRPWFADLLWFFLPLIPVLNIVDLRADALVSERFLYLPLLGLASLAARAMVPAFQSRSLVGKVCSGAIVAVVVAYAAITSVHVTHFRDEERLWTHELSVNPENHAAVKTLESVAWREGRWQEALAYDLRGYQIAVEARESRLAMEFLLRASRRVTIRTPDWDQAALVRLKQAYDDYLETNRFAFEAGQLRADMETSPEAARDVTATLGLFRFPRAVLWARTGHLAGATEQARAIVSDSPSHIEAWSLLTQLLMQREKWSEAEATLEEMKLQLPDHPGAAAIEARFEGAWAIAERPADTPAERAMRLAEVHAFLGARHTARLLLDPWVDEKPGDFALVMARAKLDVAERLFGPPRALLERGRDAASSTERERWDRALAELQMLERSPTP